MKRFIALISFLALFILVGCQQNKDDYYTITWEINGKIVETDQNAPGSMPEYNGQIPTKENDSNYSYEFAGWLPSLEAVSQDQKYVATFTSTPLSEYEVVLNLDNGSEAISLKIKEGNTLTDLPTPTKEGYTFKYWSKTSTGEAFDLTSKVTDDLILYAIYQINVYEVSLLIDSETPIQKVEVNYNELLSEPVEPVKSGYKFQGWYLDTDYTKKYDFSLPVKNNLVLYAKWQKQVEIKEYLAALVTQLDFNPYSYLPETLKPGYKSNLISADLTYDFSQFINIKDITYGGFGEQWNMVITNLEQSTIFFNLLTGLDAITSASIVAFNNYLDSNPAAANSFTYRYGIYDVYINYDNSILTYVLDFTSTIPLLGEQTIEIMLALDIKSGSKSGRIQIGEANALKYTFTANSYELALEYLGIRQAYLSLSKTETNLVTGHIYEYLTAGDTNLVKSCADFYLDQNNLVVVGNKASGMLGFTGCIVELYSVATGKLVGYEVNETLSKISYDTLWFNLEDIKGINSIKVIDESSESNKANSYTIYLNGQNTPFVTKTVGGLGLDMLSRRYDIEMRTQYFYYYDATSKSYIAKAIDMPMLFVQEDYYDTLVSDIASKNELTITLGQNIVNNKDVLIKYYDEFIPIFTENKELITPEIIKKYIGKKYDKLELI